MKNHGDGQDEVIEGQFRAERLPDVRLGQLRREVRPENVVIVQREVPGPERVVYQERPVYREAPAPPAVYTESARRCGGRLSEGAARVYVFLAILAALAFAAICWLCTRPPTNYY